jgi:N-carbamoyl-L-amino-acid hydrolase
MATSREPALIAAARVSETRLWQRHTDMAAIGATAKGGVNRQALTAEDARARALLVSWARARGFVLAADAIGNLFVRREGADPHARPILTGSHMDTQPTGGKFDGIYGVLAGFEVLEALEDAGIRTRRPIEVVAWTNEEGNRFQPGAMGSAVFAGVLDLAAMLAATDQAGVSVADAVAETLRATPVADRGTPGFPIDGYVEAHIEQGPRLEAAGCTIGVVSGVQGHRRYAVTVVGEEAHSAATPRRARKDALLAAANMVSALAPALADEADAIRFTVGRFDVYPNGPGVVPGRVYFTVNLNHPDLVVLDECTSLVHGTVAAHQGPCTATVVALSERAPVTFAPAVMEIVRRNAAALGLGQMDMLSHAGHDAMHIVRACPTGMVFVPCLRGISHNEAESATPSNLAAGTRVLAATVVGMADATTIGPNAVH